MGRSANGITLSSLEYNELEQLVSSGNPWLHAHERVDPDEREPDYDLADVYRRLREKGLVYGRDNRGRFIFDGLSADGRSFIADCIEADEDRKRRWKHDYYVALVGAIAGAVLGFATGTVSVLLFG